MAPFYGTPPMAMMTVGTGALLVGRHIIGITPAVTADEVLWAAGTLTGLVAAIAVPYLMLTEFRLGPQDVSATWLLPVVPPIVSALAGAGLISRLPAGQDRLAMLLADLGLLGMSLFASLITIIVLWGRLARQGPGAAPATPSLWIVLGPLGASITALELIADAAPNVIATQYARPLAAMALLIGRPLWGLAMLWLAIASAITIRAAREHLLFSLTWWSFTFPVANVVIGTSLLAVRTHATFLTYTSVGLFAFLVSAWVTAAAMTARGAWRGGLFLPAESPVIMHHAEVAPRAA
jgi:tellurite resistance protein TehA-like permease